MDENKTTRAKIEERLELLRGMINDVNEGTVTPGIRHTMMVGEIDALKMVLTLLDSDPTLREVKQWCEKHKYCNACKLSLKNDSLITHCSVADIDGCYSWDIDKIAAAIKEVGDEN